MTGTIIDIRVHTLFACLPHCTGKRIHARHGNGFGLNLVENVKRLNNGSPVLLTDRQDSFCRECQGKEGSCHEGQMQALDRFALCLVNQTLGRKNGNALKINEIYAPSFCDILKIRQAFKKNWLREICAYGDRTCIYLAGCVRMAERNYPKALLMPGAVPV